MNQRFFLPLLGLGILFVAPSTLVGCGDFSADEEDPVEGSGGVAGTGGDAAGTGGGTPGAGGTVEPPPEASCENVVACGGDVVGNWFAIDSCLTLGGVANLTSFGIGCTEGAIAGPLVVTGNLRIDLGVDGDPPIATDATQTYTDTASPIQIGLAPECLDVSGTMVTCDSVAGPLRSMGFTDDTACVTAASGNGGCDCTAPVLQETVPGFVTTNSSDLALYTAEGNIFSLQGNITVDYDYCVDGDFMLVTPKTVGNVGTATGTILFQRQP